jgi:t-SNARE complex subunit (syntaxin)
MDIARDMKISMAKQTKTVMRIEDNILNVKMSSENANSEINKLSMKVNKNSGNRCHILIFIITSIIIIFAVVYLYLKL